MELEVDGNIVCLYMPQKGTQALPLVYVHCDRQQANELWKKLPPNACMLAAIQVQDWNRQFSPWPAPRAFSGAEDFAGGAGEYLQCLCEKIVPQAERLLAAPACRVLAGYSLAGLFAVYGAVQSGCFAKLVCASGSLWYDGFTQKLLQMPLPKQLCAAYFSVGEREKATKNTRLQKVQDCMLETAAFFAQNGVCTKTQINPGGHFNDPDGRLAAGISWALQA